MATLTKPLLKHVIVQRQGFYYYRRIPKDVLPFYRARGEYGSGFIQRTLGTGDPRLVSSAHSRIHAEVEAEWERVRDHLRTASTPQTIDQIDDAAAKALIWKCWLAWQALGFAASRPMDDFGPWALRVIERLPPDIEFLSARSVRLWHDSLDTQPQRRLLTQYAANVVARELPGMVPALLAMPVLDLGRNPAYAEAARKPKMLSEVMDAWYGNHRRKNLKVVTGKDGAPVKVADKNYDVPFKVARNVLGANTFVNHVTRDDILELVDVICHLSKGSHDAHDRDGTPYRDLAAAAKAALEDGDEVEFNADASLNKYLGGITTLFTFAMDNTWIKEHPANGIKILGGNSSKRRALTSEELGKLFHAAYRPVVNSWVPLLMVYHGCRTNEIAQLDVADVVQRPGGLWCLRLTEEGADGQVASDKSMKTPASHRVIPIHSRVVEAGFLDFVEGRRRGGNLKLFNVAGQRAWNSIREDVSAMFAATAVYKQGEVVPYSLRHTWTAWMTDANVPAEIQEAIGGWSLSGGARKRYGRKQGTQVVRYEPEALTDHLNRLDYGPLFHEPAPEGWNMASFERMPTTRG